MDTDIMHITVYISQPLSDGYKRKSEGSISSMALMKTTASQIGVPLTYHRVTNINVFTNQNNVIFVLSYISEEERLKEIESLEKAKKYNERLENNIGDPNFDPGEPVIYQAAFSEEQVFATPYDQYMTIDSAYEYLKTLPEFEGAEDC